MRRFITSLPGRVFAQLVIMALVMPFITLASLRTAVAQVSVLPTWAVTEFRNKKSAGTQFGKTAAEAVSGELAKSGQYDVVAQPLIAAAIENLNISSPPDGQTNLLRVAQEVRASTVVSGDIIDYRILTGSGGKQAVVQMQVIVTDVASGLPVNGSVVTGRSTVRPGDVADEILISDAINQGSVAAIREIQGRQLPSGTVLNTFETSALINRGARSGFKVGQELVVVRGREQVATATISDVEPDSATIRPGRVYKGIQPGDKVRAVFVPPSYRAGIDADGNIKTVKPRRHNNSNGLITALLVVGLIVALATGPGSNTNDVVSTVTAQARLGAAGAGSPEILINWKPNGFAKGNYTRARWQVWRDDVLDSPVLVVDGSQLSAVDTTTERANGVDFLNTGRVGGTTCDNTAPTSDTSDAIPGIQVGRPYTYSVELVYRLSILDLPGTGSGSSGGGTGTTAGGTTGGTTGTTTGTTTGGTTGTTTGGTTGTTTGGTTGGTGSTGSSDASCYFVSQRTVAKGVATALPASNPQSPADGTTISTPQPFEFTSVSTGTFGIAVEYIVQVSPSLSFPKSQTFTIATLTSTALGKLSTPSKDTTGSNVPSYIRNATTIYWRVGARNIADRPGPVADSKTGDRYIFSNYRSFTRPTDDTPLPPR